MEYYILSSIIMNNCQFFSMWMTKTRLLQNHRKNLRARWLHPKHSVDGEGYNIIHACQCTAVRGWLIDGFSQDCHHPKCTRAVASDSSTNIGTLPEVTQIADWHAPVKYCEVGNLLGRDVWRSGLFAVMTFHGLYIFLILVAWSTIFISKYEVNFESKHANLGLNI